MNRRVFAMSALGIGLASRASAQEPNVPSWERFKPEPGSLKEKVHKSGPIRRVSAPYDASRTQLEDIIENNGNRADLISVDTQHMPLPDERVFTRFCKLAEEAGVGVQVRLQHPRLSFMTGRFADLGAQAVLVPFVEEEDQANDAIDNFYYPPLGNRSYAPASRFGETPSTERLEYARWWNRNCLLGFQIETLRGAINARKIIKPGVDWISWGPADMAFDLERHSNSPFKTLEEVHSYVIEQLKGYDVNLPGS